MATAETHYERSREPAEQLEQAIESLEAVKRTDMPGISTLTAATFCRKPQWSRAALE